MNVNKSQKLEKLKQKELKADLPLKDTANSLVFGEGSPNAEVYFLGEAPGRFEDISGRPFVGQAGKLLDKLLESIDLKREDVFITSVLHFRPPENRDPTSNELIAFEPFVNKQIEIINPKIIVTLGRFSLNKFLPDKKISEVHGKPQKISWNKMNFTVIPMYHPAAGLRRGSIKEAIFEDFKEVSKNLADR